MTENLHYYPQLVHFSYNISDVLEKKKIRVAKGNNCNISHIFIFRVQFALLKQNLATHVCDKKFENFWQNLLSFDFPRFILDYLWIIPRFSMDYP